MHGESAGSLDLFALTPRYRDWGSMPKAVGGGAVDILEILEMSTEFLEFHKFILASIL